jgi:hypothetical protein
MEDTEDTLSAFFSPFDLTASHRQSRMALDYGPELHENHARPDYQI